MKTGWTKFKQALNKPTINHYKYNMNFHIEVVRCFWGFQFDRFQISSMLSCFFYAIKTIAVSASSKCAKHGTNFLVLKEALAFYRYKFKHALIF